MFALDNHLAKERAGSGDDMDWVLQYLMRGNQQVPNGRKVPGSWGGTVGQPSLGQRGQRLPA